MSAERWNYRDGDLELRGEIYRPTITPNGLAVLVVHEADGIGGNVREHCGRLAELGYIAAAADMHGSGRVLQGVEMQAALAAFRADTGLLRRRINAALDALSSFDGMQAGRTAAIGFCFGGTAVLELARSGAAVAAVASFTVYSQRLRPPGEARSARACLLQQARWIRSCRRQMLRRSKTR